MYEEEPKMTRVNAYASVLFVLLAGTTSAGEAVFVESGQPKLVKEAGWAEGLNGEPVDVYTSGSEGYDTFRIPAIIVTTRGTLLAFCEGRKHGGGDAGESCFRTPPAPRADGSRCG
jgi:hypothetical protein